MPAPDAVPPPVDAGPRALATINPGASPPDAGVAAAAADALPSTH
jgi:hypothetical protein